nr:hypothetical protein [Candidatus Sigynarchaeota archaeon]
MMLDFGKRKPFRFHKARALILPAFWVHQFLPDENSKVMVTGNDKELIIKIVDTPIACGPGSPGAPAQNTKTKSEV